MGIGLGGGGAGGVDLPGMVNAYQQALASGSLPQGGANPGAGGAAMPAPTQQGGASPGGMMNPLAAMLAGQGPAYRPPDTTWGFSGDRLMRFTPQTGLNQGGGGGAGGGALGIAGGPGGGPGMFPGAPPTPYEQQLRSGSPGGLGMSGGAGGGGNGVPGVTRTATGGFDLGAAGQDLVDRGTAVASPGGASPAFDAVRSGRTVNGMSPYDTWHAEQINPATGQAFGGTSDALRAEIARNNASDKSVAPKRGLPAWKGQPLSYAEESMRQNAYDASLGLGGELAIDVAKAWERMSGERFPYKGVNDG